MGVASALLFSSVYFFVWTLSCKKDSSLRVVGQGAIEVAIELLRQTSAPLPVTENELREKQAD